MKNQYVPRHARTPAAALAHGIPDSSLKGHAGAAAAPRILAITLALASLGAGAAVMSGHAGAARPADYASHASTSATGTTARPSVNWMF